MLAATVVRSRERAVLLNPKLVRLQIAKDFKLPSTLPLNFLITH